MGVDEKKYIVIKRLEKFDYLKGLLIVLVVIGHYKRGLLHDVIFLFHMPVFFIISGIFLGKEKLTNSLYMKRKVSSLVLPYISYLVIDNFFLQKNYSIKSFIKLLWGGRSIAGIYWYITCFLFSLLLLGFIYKKFNGKEVKFIVIASLFISILESNLSNLIPLLKFPGIPLNIDVSLLAIFYIYLGIRFKSFFKKLARLGVKHMIIFFS